MNIRTILFTLALGFMLPTVAYAATDGSNIVNPYDNDHTQTLHVTESEVGGVTILDSITMYTETTGDHAWKEGAMMLTQSMVITVDTGGTAESVVVYCQQRPIEYNNGYVKTEYEIVSPTGQSIDAYMRSQLSDEAYYGFVAAATGKGSDVTGNYLSNTGTYVEANGALAITNDGATQDYWTSYLSTGLDGSVRNVSLMSIVNGKVETAGGQKYTLQDAANRYNSTKEQIAELNAQLNGMSRGDPSWSSVNDRLELLKRRNAEIGAAIDKYKGSLTMLTSQQAENIVQGLLTNDKDLNFMLDAIKTACEAYGYDPDEFDGLMNDKAPEVSSLLMSLYNFYDSTTEGEHRNWKLIGEKLKEITSGTEWHPGIGIPYTPPYKEETPTTWRDGTPYSPPYVTPPPEKPDFRTEPYNPWGEIKHSAVDKEYHRVGADGNIFNLGEPIAYVYNDSVEYDDYAGHHVGFADEGDSDGNGNGIIIPSSEKYLNGITVNTTNGKASLGLGSQTSTYVGKYSYQVLQRIVAWEKIKIYLVGGSEVSKDDYDDARDDYHNNPYTSYSSNDFDTDYKVEGRVIDGCIWSCDFGSHPGITVSTQRVGYYLYLEDLDVKDFNMMSTYNDTFTNDMQDYYATTDPHVFRDIAPGEVRVNSIGGFVQGRPTTYHVEEGYKDGAVNITSTASNSASGAKTSNFVPDGAWHLSWDVDPTDWGYGNYDLGTFTVSQTAEEVGIYGDFESVPTASGEYHYWGGNVTNNPPTSLSSATSKAQNRLEYDVGDMKNVSTKTAGGEVYHLATYKTGKLQLPGVGAVATDIMSGQSGKVTHQGASDKWDSSFTGNEVPSYLKPVMTAILSAGQAYQNSKEQMIESYESTPALGKEQQHIPDTQANGEYPTSIRNVTYKQVLVAKTMAGKTTTGMGIKPIYTTNEPIIIQTPVVSPVSIWIDDGSEHGSAALEEYGPGDGENQLVNEDSSVRQFRLDENYWFKFDPLQHLITQGYADINGIPFDNTWRKDDIKFDKYTEAKYVHFPFDVCLYEDGVDGSPTYHPHVSSESDPDYWIKIYDRNDSSTEDNIEWTKFYIPAWAHEDAYTSGDVIKYKVEAINVINGRGEQEEANNVNNPDKHPDKEKYVATYTIKCQVSGWMYNFQVVGTNLRDLYDQDLTEEQSDLWHDLYYAYCFDREEKKAGVWNRLANDLWDRYDWVSNYVRYTNGGDVTTHWDPKDTIIIAAHNSHRLNNPGLSPAGTQFAYSFQSMANLWNEGDWIEIKPTFKYVKDGTTYVTDPNSGTDRETSGTTSSLHVYYDDYETGNEVKRLVEYGSNTDTNNWHSVSLADEMFLASYRKEDADRSARYPAPDYDGDGDIAGFHDTVTDRAQESLTNAFLNKKVKETYTLKTINLKSGLRVFSGDESELKTGLKKDYGTTQSVESQYRNASGTQGLMDNAVQTWYGEYWLPSDLYVTTKTRQELQEYAEKHGGLQPDDPVFMHGGVLIVHFDIIAHNSKDPDQDLRYSGGNGGSHGFKNEKAGDPGDPDDYYDVKVGDPNTPGGSGAPGGEITISVQYGDVIMIDPDTSIDQWYRSAYWTIN